MDSNKCPFCKSDNNCMADRDAPCWCNEVTVPRGLTDLVPEEKKWQACICLKCINEYQKNSEIFKLKYS